MKNLFQEYALKGFSLIEVMLSMAIIGISFLAIFGAFQSSQGGIVVGRRNSRGLQLAEERLAEVQRFPYSRVLVTTEPATIPDTTPERYHDPQNYPPLQYHDWGTTFMVYTWVEQVQLDPITNNITPVAPTNTDTSLKQIHVTVVWSSRGDTRFRELAGLRTKDVMGNPVWIDGHVTDVNGVNIKFAPITFASTAGNWKAFSDNFGNYHFRVLTGSGTLSISAPPRFIPQTRDISIPSTAASQVENFLLSPAPSWTISGSVWISSRPLISAVAASIDDAGFAQEFVEIYNPSTSTWDFGGGGLGLRFGQDNLPPVDVSLNSLISTCVYSHGFFLFANRPNVKINGFNRPADAVWTPGNLINTKNENGFAGYGGLELYRQSDGQVLDRVGWSVGGHPPPVIYSGTPVDALGGIQAGEEFLRLTSTGAVFLPIPQPKGVWRAPAYDSGNNNIDFILTNLATEPFSSDGGVLLSTRAEPIAGTPAVGAWVAATVPFWGTSIHSTPVVTTPSLSGGYPYALYSLTMQGESFPNSTIAICPNIGFGRAVGPSFRNFCSFTPVPGRRINRFSGVVRDGVGLPIPGTVVRPQNGEVAYSGATGEFDFIADCNWILANSSEYTPFGLSPVHPSFFPVDAHIDSFSPQSLTHISGIDVTLPSRIHLTGKLLYEDGLPAEEGIPIQFFLNGTLTPEKTLTNAAGEFDYYIASGTWDVVPDIQTSSNYFCDPSTRTVTAINPGERIDIDPYIVKAQTMNSLIKGKVRWGGAPIVDGGVILSASKTKVWGASSPPTYGGLSYSTVSRPDGTFEIAVPAGGSYHLEAWAIKVSAQGNVTRRYRILTNADPNILHLIFF